MRESNFDPEKADRLLETYKIADENHRFYVENRFRIISLYIPVVTVVLSGIYYFAKVAWYYRALVSLVGFVLTVFLYSLECRNWILSNICSERCQEIGRRIDGNENLHVELAESFKDHWPKPGPTFLDRSVRWLANTQHRTVSRVTCLLLLYWGFFLAISIPQVATILIEIVRSFVVLATLDRDLANIVCRSP